MLNVVSIRIYGFNYDSIGLCTSLYLYIGKFYHFLYSTKTSRKQTNLWSTLLVTECEFSMTIPCKYLSQNHIISFVYLEKIHTLFVKFSSLSTKCKITFYIFLMAFSYLNRCHILHKMPTIITDHFWLFVWLSPKTI